MTELNQPLPPIAFLSYTRFDDDYHDRKISRYADRLANEVRVHTGLDFKVFVDRSSISWGENWRARIKEGIDSSAFLIIFMTPSYFKSQECFKEYCLFVERESQLGRNDLILAIQYIACDELLHPSKCFDEKWARDLSERQYRNWDDKNFRKLSENSRAYRDELEDQAKEIKLALHDRRVISISNFSPSVDPAPIEIVEDKITISAVQGVPDVDPRLVESLPWHARKHPRLQNTLIVDSQDSSKYMTIGSAITRANPGDVILIRPGIYFEELFVSKRLFLIGDGDEDEISIVTMNRTALSVGAPFVEVRNIRFRTDILDGQHSWEESAIIEHNSGVLNMRQCVISGGTTGIRSEGGTELQLIDCAVQDCLFHGIVVDDCHTLIIKGTVIEMCHDDGVRFKNVDKASIHYCWINDNHGWGIVARSEVDLKDNLLRYNTKGDTFVHPTDKPPF